MIKQGIFNYFKSLKYFFTPLGTLALGLILGVSIAIPSMLSALRVMVERIIEISGTAQLDVRPFLNSLWDSVTALNWREPITALRTILSDDWLNSALQTSLRSFVENYEPLAAELGEAVQTCVSQMTLALVVVVIFTVIGVIGGYFLTKHLIRRRMARRQWWKYVLVTLADSLLTAGIAFLGVWISELWGAGRIVLALIVPPLLFSIVSMLEAYLVYGVKRVKLKEVITLKNTAKLLLVNLVVFYISIAFGVIVAAIFNTLAGLIIGFTLLEIAYIVMGMNADTYVKSLTPPCEDTENVAIQ